MAANRNDLLGDIPSDAALDRTDFLVQATDQLRAFLERHDERVREIGGLTLIDDDPDYLAIAPDGTFRSRSRYLDDDTGEWVSETEVIESAAELVELYNPADIYAAFAEASREAAGLPEEPTATDDLMDTAGVAPEESVALDGEDPYAAAADDWAATQSGQDEPTDEETAARRLYDLALAYQERSQRTEARLLEQFSDSSETLTAKLGDLIVADDEDERLTLQSFGGFRAEVVPEDSNGEWRTLATPDALGELYAPTDVFGDLADALAEAYPAVAPEEGEASEGAEDLVDGEGPSASADAAEDETDGGEDDGAHRNGTGDRGRG